MSTELISIFVAILSLIFAIFFFLKSRKEKIPCWSFKSDVVIGRKQNSGKEEIKILFKDKIVVNQVTSTKIFIWNKGREVIKSQDVPVQDISRIVFPENINILRAEIIKKTRDSVDAKLIKKKTKEGNVIEYTYNFMDHRDGFLIEVIHDGGKDTEIKNVGTILGVRKGFKSINKEKTNPILNVLPFSIAIFLVLSVVIFIDKIGRIKTGQDSSILSWLSLAGILIIWIPVILYFIFEMLKVTVIPRELL